MVFPNLVTSFCSVEFRLRMTVDSALFRAAVDYCGYYFSTASQQIRQTEKANRMNAPHDCQQTNA
jgi:hypothetical protein